MEKHENMSYNLNEEKIVIEIQNLINDIDSVKETFDDYCQMLKEMFLSGSGKN